MSVLRANVWNEVICVSTNKDKVAEGYSPNDELYMKFGKGFINALDDGVQIATGKKTGHPARELVDELKTYVAEAGANEYK